MPRSGTGDEEAATVAVTAVVRPGKERQFAEWADQIDRSAAEFPGHLGGVRLHDASGLNHLVYQFDTKAHLREWEESPQRKELAEKGEAFSDKRRTVVGGLDRWFEVPGSDASQRWKTFLLTWVAAFPILLVVNTTLTWLFPALPKPVSLALTSGTLTALLTFVVLPFLNRRARPWLLRGAKAEPSEESGGAG
ncbi:antibiotic biosynthesis monooxygenase [Fodinicola acaciae]|uniref:antibiotic biosynthesis monooxygenase n=1 Tax=Fodinicola acaciae TaxID=2681555 RepID=UPI0013D59BCB|nr:antibiotic biosynthesis monooxygenase [Fodinicola acaciae]